MGRAARFREQEKARLKRELMEARPDIGEAAADLVVRAGFGGQPVYASTLQVNPETGNEFVEEVGWNHAIPDLQFLLQVLQEGEKMGVIQHAATSD